MIPSNFLSDLSLLRKSSLNKRILFLTEPALYCRLVCQRLGKNVSRMSQTAIIHSNSSVDRSLSPIDFSTTSCQNDKVKLCQIQESSNEENQGDVVGVQGWPRGFEELR